MPFGYNLWLQGDAEQSHPLRSAAGAVPQCLQACMGAELQYQPQAVAKATYFFFFIIFIFNLCFPLKRHRLKMNLENHLSFSGVAL